MTTPEPLRLATREETSKAIIYRFAPIGDPNVTVYTVYKTDPPSFKYEPSRLHATKTLRETWQELAADHDESGVIWTNI